MKSVEEMSRQELSENIVQSLVHLTEAENHYHELKKYYKSPGSKYYEWSVVICIMTLIFSIFFWTVVGYLVNLPTLAFVFFIITAVLLFKKGLPMLTHKLEEKFFYSNQRKYHESFKDIMDSLRNKMNEAADAFNELCVIPAPYDHRHALERFDNYTSYFRASNIGECINLYETEMQNLEMRNQLADIKASQEIQQQLTGDSLDEIRSSRKQISALEAAVSYLGNEASTMRERLFRK
ncbi:hypothetical protein [Halobacillus sp. Cin3]|uniref:hypothetical protein n=1 Tax=Halobacillus sp. Cin3 TaxID=2928441 RepID=UPI00248ED87A|nr:hypothetical protein [Halobacillus sp. Cin3]